MSLVRWDPFAELDSTLNRLMRSPFAGMPRLSGNGGAKLEWSPSADISETEKEYLIRAELPAVKKEDVKVTVDHGMITIEGERKVQQEDKSEKYHRRESFHGTFSRSFSLPESIASQDNLAELKNGVLRVTFKKKPEVLPRQIEVH